MKTNRGWHRHEEGPPCHCPMGRFWMCVDKMESGCWEWLASRDQDGYGLFRVNSRQVRVHRWSYETFVGPFDEALHLDHLCRNPSCVNPDHLEPVTSRENAMRGIGPTAINAAKTHCVRGHEFTEENTHVWISNLGHPQRRCRTCERARWAVSNRRRRAKAQASQKESV